MRDIGFSRIPPFGSVFHESGVVVMEEDLRCDNKDM